MGSHVYVPTKHTSVYHSSLNRRACRFSSLHIRPVYAVSASLTSAGPKARSLTCNMSASLASAMLRWKDMTARSFSKRMDTVIGLIRRLKYISHPDVQRELMSLLSAPEESVSGSLIAFTTAQSRCNEHERLAHDFRNTYGFQDPSFFPL